MSRHLEQACRTEAAYLAGVGPRLRRGAGAEFPGSRWDEVRLDGEDAVRRYLTSQSRFDRALLGQLPKSRRVELRGWTRRWFVRRKPTAVVIASVCAPAEGYVAAHDGERAPEPLRLGDLLAHIERIAPDRRVPHIIGVCSPSGFADDVTSRSIELDRLTLVGITSRDDGGWVVRGLSADADDRICSLFDPSTPQQQQRRVESVIAERSVELMTGGLSVDALADELDVAPAAVRQAFERAAAADPELQISTDEPNWILYRGAAADQEDSVMSVGDWVRQLFGVAGNEEKKINMLSERRVKLAHRRDRIYEDIAKLEHREADLLQQGKENKSPVVRQRVASQLAQHRREMRRLNTTASMLNQQVNVISTHIHNLTLIQQGKMAKLPASEELTEDAVRAEEMLEQLKSDADLAGSLSTGIDETLMSQEEMDILKEFEEADAAPSEKPPTAEPKADVVEEPTPEQPERDHGTPEAN